MVWWGLKCLPAVCLSLNSYFEGVCVAPARGVINSGSSLASAGRRCEPVLRCCVPRCLPLHSCLSRLPVPQQLCLPPPVPTVMKRLGIAERCTESSFGLSLWAATNRQASQRIFLDTRTPLLLRPRAAALLGSTGPGKPPEGEFLVGVGTARLLFLLINLASADVQLLINAANLYWAF